MLISKDISGSELESLLSPAPAEQGVFTLEPQAAFWPLGLQGRGRDVHFHLQSVMCERCDEVKNATSVKCLALLTVGATK